MRHRAELDEDFGRAPHHALAGAQIEGHALPAPIIDMGLDGHEGFRVAVAAQFLVDHRAFVDDDQLGLGRVAFTVDDEGRALLVDPARAVDQGMDGLGFAAALVAQHQRGLAGVGGEDDIAVHRLGDVPGERGLAGAGIAEQAEHLRRARLQPARHLGQGGILLKRPAHRKAITADMPQMGPSRAPKASPPALRRRAAAGRRRPPRPAGRRCARRGRAR